MFLFVRIRFRGTQGKNREPGLQAFCVSKRTGSQILIPISLQFKTPRMRGF